MEKTIYIPTSQEAAAHHVRHALRGPLDRLPEADFIRACSSIVYFFPGLHPDGFDDPDSDWPRVVKRFAAEEWRHTDVGELDDKEVYCYDAAWSATCDRMLIKPREENKRRLELAVAYGECVNV